jgi:hypothetical protein
LPSAIEDTGIREDKDTSRDATVSSQLQNLLFYDELLIFQSSSDSLTGLIDGEMLLPYVCNDWVEGRLMTCFRVSK